MEHASEPNLTPRKRRRFRQGIRVISAILVIYVAVAYVVLPVAWRLVERRHPALEQTPRNCRTSSGIPGDPINLGLVASDQELLQAMAAAGWNPADPITLRSSLRIAAATVLKRSYDDAPVSSLYLWGKKENLAFEKSVGNNPRARHHVRFWKSTMVDASGRPLWAGAATFDVKVGLSRRTGQITHHIGPDVDADRDLVIADLRRAGRLRQSSWLDHFQEQTEGRNGGGDRYHTDRRLAYGVLETEPGQLAVGR